MLNNRSVSSWSYYTTGQAHGCDLGHILMNDLKEAEKITFHICTVLLKSHIKRVSNISADKDSKASSDLEEDTQFNQMKFKSSSYVLET